MHELLWLDYKNAANDTENTCFGAECIKRIYLKNFDKEDVVVKSAMKEIEYAAEGLLHTTTVMVDDMEKPTIVLEHTKSLEQASETDREHLLEGRDISLLNEGYQIQAGHHYIVIRAQESKGLLYGVFRFLCILRQGRFHMNINITEVPKNPLRMLNHWDNMDGSIERGYSGLSFFLHKDQVLVNQRTVDYARLVASVGINAVVINNVNVRGSATELITTRYYSYLKELSKIFHSYGIALYLSINYAMPCEYGCSNADPLDEEVREWWKEKCREVYENIPNLGGFLVKADSEGRPGPFTYQRTQADGANMLAEAIEPYGGRIIWRCFVYNCQQDWRDTKTDRAKAGFDYFSALDGQFHKNVILQIKNGPMDFQVREPVSPLFGGLSETNQMLEVQIAQEYTGQQRHVCYLIPWFKQILEHQTYLTTDNNPNGATVTDLISGKALKNYSCGIAAVANTGDDDNWTGHDLAGANLYGFGRLAFDTDLSAEEIASEWIRMTFIQAMTEDCYSQKCGSKIEDTIKDILMSSWPAYENYSSPLGIGWMVTPNTHYGPDVDGYEYSRWGTYHRADHLGIGVDRTKQGTGFTAQYQEPNASIYERVETCPEELLLFFHHMPYTYRLKTGKTIVQHIYDTHYQGAEMVDKMVEQWSTLKENIDSVIYNRVEQRLLEQQLSSREWRDVINSYFYRKSGILDEQNRPLY